MRATRRELMSIEINIIICMFFSVSLAPLCSILDTNLIERIDENLFSNLRHLQLL